MTASQRTKYLNLQLIWIFESLFLLESEVMILFMRRKHDMEKETFQIQCYHVTFKQSFK